MPDWLLEHGIGESRAVLIRDGEIIEAQVFLSGIARAGSRRPATLKQVGPPTIAVANGQEYLLPKGAPRVAEGAALIIEVTREALPGVEPWKRPLAKVTRESPGARPLIDAETVSFPSPIDRLSEAGWNDLVEEARSGIVRFAGGELRISPTPAMTLIDVDGYLAVDELAVVGAAAAAKAIRRLDIGGSIGIDLPTSGSRSVRQSAAAAIDAHLPQPFERTAVNGFGFLQVVRPRLRASLAELAQNRPTFEARALLRRAALGPPGPTRLVAHPAMIANYETNPAWLDELSGQVGGSVSLRADAGLPMSGGYAEKA